MAINKSEAVVTRSLRLGETSKIVWLYTKDFGRVKVVAKGARSAKNRFGSSLELFTHCSVVFYQKDRRDLQLLSESDTLRHFSVLETDVARFAFASACIELLNTMIVGEDANPPLFQLLLDTLRSFEECPRQGLRSVFWSFELKAAGLLGYKPELFQCSRCNKGGELKRFAPLKGGMLCRACGLRESDSFEISVEARDLMRRLQTNSFSDVATEAPAPKLESEVDRTVEIFLQFHVDRLPGLKSLKLLKSLR